MQQIISLGCSLTAQSGYINYLNRTHDLNIKNLAVSAGSNELQSFRLNNLLVENQVERDAVLLWQITTPYRSLQTFSAEDSEPHNSNCGDPAAGVIFDCFYEKTGLYNDQSLLLLCNHKYFDNYLPNVSYNFHMTACDIFKWSFLVKHIIVYLGWSWLDCDDNVNKSLDFLKTVENITVIPKENSILDVCKNNNWSLKDDFHPTEESYINWGKQVLEPVLLSKIKI